MAKQTNDPHVGVSVTFSHQPSAISHEGVRLWRVRKNRTWIDARVTTGPAAAEVQFFLDGERVFSRKFPDRALAAADAQRRLRDLQRAGWTTHW